MQAELTGVAVGVGVLVGVAVGAIAVGVLVGVAVGDATVGVLVGVAVGTMAVGVRVGVAVRVAVRVGVGFLGRASESAGVPSSKRWPIAKAATAIVSAPRGLMSRIFKQIRDPRDHPRKVDVIYGSADAIEPSFGGFCRNSSTRASKSRRAGVRKVARNQAGAGLAGALGSFGTEPASNAALRSRRPPTRTAPSTPRRTRGCRAARDGSRGGSSRATARSGSACCPD